MLRIDSPTQCTIMTHFFGLSTSFILRYLGISCTTNVSEKNVSKSCLNQKKYDPCWHFDIAIYANKIGIQRLPIIYIQKKE